MNEHFNDKPWVSPVHTLDSNNPTPLSEVTNINDGKRSLFCNKELPSKRK